MKMERLCGVTGPDVVILSDDFAEMERKSCFRVKQFPHHDRFRMISRLRVMPSLSQ